MRGFQQKVLIGIDLNPFHAISKVASAVVDAFEDVATSIVDRIPGSDWIKGAVNTVGGPVGDFLHGPFKDFANSTVGEVVIRAFSVAVSGGIMGAAILAGPVAASVGSALAFAAWSIPGLAKGEPFDEALIHEFVYRVKAVITFFSATLAKDAADKLGAEMGDQLGTAVQDIKDVLVKAYGDGVNLDDVRSKLTDQALQNMGLTPGQLAAKLGIRQDVAAYAIAWAKRDMDAVARIKDEYDPATGNLKIMPMSASLLSSLITYEAQQKDAARVNSAVTATVATPSITKAIAMSTPKATNPAEALLRGTSTRTPIAAAAQAVGIPAPPSASSSFASAVASARAAANPMGDVMAPGSAPSAKG